MIDLAAIGIIGLGAMGGAMARNLLAAGKSLVVYDIDPAKCDAFASVGATRAASPADVALRARRIICMVETTAQVRQVVEGADGIVTLATPGHRIACMSTIAPK